MVHNKEEKEIILEGYNDYIKKCTKTMSKGLKRNMAIIGWIVIITILFGSFYAGWFVGSGINYFIG